MVFAVYQVAAACREAIASRDLGSSLSITMPWHLLQTLPCGTPVSSSSLRTLSYVDRMRVVPQWGHSKMTLSFCRIMIARLTFLAMIAYPRGLLPQSILIINDFLNHLPRYDPDRDPAGSTATFLRTIPREDNRIHPGQFQPLSRTGSAAGSGPGMLPYKDCSLCTCPPCELP